MKRAIDETNRRRGVQQAYNTEHGITPMTIVKDIRELLSAGLVAEEEPVYEIEGGEAARSKEDLIAETEKKMLAAARELHFEEAARLRDLLIQLQGKPMQSGPATPKRHLNAKQAVRQRGRR